MTVGAKTWGIGNWVTNIGIVVGSSGVGPPDAEVLVPTEADLSLQVDMTSDRMARMISPPDATEVMRFCFLAMFPSFFGTPIDDASNDQLLEEMALIRTMSRIAPKHI
jgi:hypothetical protein